MIELIIIILIIILLIIMEWQAKLKHFSLPKPAHVISSFKQSLKVVVKAKMLDRSVTCFELF